MIKKIPGGERRVLCTGCPDRGPVLPGPNLARPPTNFCKHKDDNRVANQARVRARAAGTAIAQRHSCLHCRRGELLFL